MKFRELRLKGAHVIEPELNVDDRGFFARVWCQDEFEAHGLNPRLVQCSVSHNVRKGTLRGIHYQAEPFREAKLVRCVVGAIYDVVVDMRASSRTFLEWEAVELVAKDYCMLYIPEGFAHGFQTLEDGSDMFYQMSETYHPESARGLRWNDPAFNIIWPLPHPILSARDKDYADFDISKHQQ